MNDSRKATITRYLIYTGALGTLVLVLNGFRVVLGRLSQREALGELVAIIPPWGLLGLWTLSPYWGALRLLQRRPVTRGGSNVVMLAVVVVIALAANSFFATSAFVGGKPHPTADGVTLVLIPIVQWILLGAAGLFLSVRRVERHSE
jgi:hypothetical protein